MTASLDAYCKGVEAGKAGAEVWQNPHCTTADGPMTTSAWYSGWCAGRQQRAKEAAAFYKATLIADRDEK